MTKNIIVNNIKSTIKLLLTVLLLIESGYKCHILYLLNISFMQAILLMTADASYGRYTVLLS